MAKLEVVSGKEFDVKDPARIELDKVLARIMQNGTSAEAQAAFNQIYSRYKSPIFYHSFRFLGGSQEDSQDAVQEIFARVFNKIGTYDFSTALSTWMYSIATNHLIDMKRKSKLEVFSIDNLITSEKGEDSTSDFSFQIEDHSTNTFSTVLRKERAIAVRAALAHLKSDLAREVIDLIFIQELPYEEVAAQLNTPIGTIKGLMHRSKELMKDFLSKESLDFHFGRVFTDKKVFKTVAQMEAA